MTPVIAAEVFGREVPSGGIGLAVAAGIVAIFLANRFAGGDVGPQNRVGRGPMHRCKRCGRDFQTEQVELLANGDVRQWIDDHCPNCGWDLDWGSPDKPGGSSGSW